MEANEIAALESESTGGLEEIKRKTKLIGTVKKITIAGAIVDIGMGVPGVVHISQLQENPTNRVEDVVKVGQTVDVWVKRVDPRKERIELTMIEPLPLEWREIKKGMVVKGKVTRLEKFGAFVDIGAERPGLVHISEMTHGYLRTPEEFVKEGDEVETQVLAVNRRKKQIKLSMKALEEEVVKVTKEERPSRVSKPAEKASSEEPATEVIPTAMEMALREAMERSNGDITPDQSGQRRKSKSGNVAYDAIFERTLHNKVRTSR
jgi:small subunit ribosomal protein S1